MHYVKLESIPKASSKQYFSFKFIIHDVLDDETAEIIKGYENRYPSKVKVVFKEENQYSQGNDYIFDVIRE